MRTSLLGLALLGTATAIQPALADEALAKIKNIVVIYAENRSFDHLYGFFPGANGIANATTEQKTQLDHDGRRLPDLTMFANDGKPDPRFPRMPNAPFRIDAPPIDMPPTTIVPSPIHAFYHNQEQINGGSNNMFAAMSTVGGWAMGYFDGSQLRSWQWAKEYMLADNFFMGAFGGSYLNHQWLICACTPASPECTRGDARAARANGKLEKKPDSPRPRTAPCTSQRRTAVRSRRTAIRSTRSQPPLSAERRRTAREGGPWNWPTRRATRSGLPVPPQTAKTIGDTLSAKGDRLGLVRGGWNAALADGRRPPAEKRKVIYTRETARRISSRTISRSTTTRGSRPARADRAAHLKDGDDFLHDIDAGTLPPVAFYKPVGRYTQHPSYTDLVSGDMHIDDLLQRLRAARSGSDMVVIVTYDENGGYWDHAPPPSGPGWGDRCGPASRIPAIIVSPFARRGFDRPHRLRHNLDPEADHPALRTRTACRGAREDRRPHRGAGPDALTTY